MLKLRQAAMDGHETGAERNAVKCSVCMQSIIFNKKFFWRFFGGQEDAPAGTPGTHFLRFIAAGCSCAKPYWVRFQ